MLMPFCPQAHRLRSQGVSGIFFPASVRFFLSRCKDKAIMFQNYYIQM